MMIYLSINSTDQFPSLSLSLSPVYPYYTFLYCAVLLCIIASIWDSFPDSDKHIITLHQFK